MAALSSTLDRPFRVVRRLRHVCSGRRTGHIEGVFAVPGGNACIAGRPGGATGAEAVVRIFPYTRIVAAAAGLLPTPFAATANEAAVGHNGYEVGFSAGAASQFQTFSF